MTEPVSRFAAKAARAAAIAEAAIQADLESAARADAFVQAFVEMTPAQLAAYIDANLTDLASARTLIKKMALMLLLLARREYR